MILWHQHQVELPKKSAQFIHAQVYPRGIEQFPTQPINNKITCTTYLETT